MNREKIYVICNSHIGLRDPMLALQHIPELFDYSQKYASISQEKKKCKIFLKKLFNVHVSFLLLFLKATQIYNYSKQFNLFKSSQSFIFLKKFQ